MGRYVIIIVNMGNRIEGSDRAVFCAAVVGAGVAAAVTALAIKRLGRNRALGAGAFSGGVALAGLYALLSGGGKAQQLKFTFIPDMETQTYRLKGHVREHRNRMQEDLNKERDKPVQFLNGKFQIPPQTREDAHREQWIIGDDESREYIFFQGNDADSPSKKVQNEFLNSVQRLAPNRKADEWAQDILDICNQKIIKDLIARHIFEDYANSDWLLSQAPNESLECKVTNNDEQLCYAISRETIVSEWAKPYDWGPEGEPQAHDRVKIEVTFKQSDDDAILTIHKPKHISLEQDRLARAARD